MRKIGRWYDNGDKRTRRVFLLFPKSKWIGNRTIDWRWLEWATLEETYYSSVYGSCWGFDGFVDEEANEVI
jgi:hypothetical protein